MATIWQLTVVIVEGKLQKLGVGTPNLGQIPEDSLVPEVVGELGTALFCDELRPQKLWLICVSYIILKEPPKILWKSH